jgi:hypothetical protein
MSLERECVNGIGLQVCITAGQSVVDFCGALPAPTYSRSSDIPTRSAPWWTCPGRRIPDLATSPAHDSSTGGHPWVEMSLERECVNGIGLQIGITAGQSVVGFCKAPRAPTYSRSSDIPTRSAPWWTCPGRRIPDLATSPAHDSSTGGHPWVEKSLERECVNGIGLQVCITAGQSIVNFCKAPRAPTYSRSSDIPTRSAPWWACPGRRIPDLATFQPAKRQPSPASSSQARQTTAAAPPAQQQPRKARPS